MKEALTSDQKASKPMARVEIVISIDCLSGGRLGFGCHGNGYGDLTEDALGMMAALQDTINRFAHANGIPGFDCTKVNGDPS